MPSSFFLICFPDGREFNIADCEVNIALNGDELLSLAIASDNTSTSLLDMANVAMLSFLTDDSGKGERVNLVRDWPR